MTCYTHRRSYGRGHDEKTDSRKRMHGHSALRALHIARTQRSPAYTGKGVAPRGEATVCCGRWSAVLTSWP